MTDTSEGGQVGAVEGTNIPEIIGDPGSIEYYKKLALAVGFTPEAIANLDLSHPHSQAILDKVQSPIVNEIRERETPN
jgi:hypothetical protein